jgi:hypothetical protein
LQNYETSESKLRKEFEQFGPIKKIFMAHDIKTRKPRGYAFIEYERERDMHCKSIGFDANYSLKKQIICSGGVEDLSFQSAVPVAIDEFSFKCFHSSSLGWAWVFPCVTYYYALLQ